MTSAILIFDQAICKPPGNTFNVYIASLAEDDFIMSCGGSIISKRAVLTSAHCLCAPLETYIIAGQLRFNLTLPIQPSSGSEGQIRKVTKIMLHSKSRRESEFDYDVAVASFDEDLTLGVSAQAIRLNPLWVRSSDPIVLFGWVHSSGSQRRFLGHTNVGMVCRSKARDVAQQGALENLNVITDGVIFVKHEAQNLSLCYGYSGLAMTVRDSQIGIASFGVDSDCEGLSAIMSIKRHLRWIKKTMAMLEAHKGANIQHTVTGDAVVNEKKNESKTMAKGIWLNKNLAKARIKNGTRITSPETYPFLVAIAKYKSMDPASFELPFCTGTILTQWIVLTAAHCIVRTLFVPMIVYAGIVDTSKFTEQGEFYQAIRVSRFLLHESYDNALLHNDIALLLLSTPLQLSTRVTPICQPYSEEVPPLGKPITNAGWGILEDWTTPTYPSWKDTTVGDVIPAHSSNGRFFLNLSRTTACDGDSGSPYFTDDLEIVGVHNAAVKEEKGCFNHGSFASSVGWYLDWITNRMESLEGVVEG